MDRERWEQLKEIFSEASELPQGKRAAFLDSRCAGDAPLRAEVERLLRHYERLSGFLEEPAMATNDAPPEPLLSEGNLIAGRFVIRRFLGRGGMGEVYEAADLQLAEQLIALKIILPSIAWNSSSRERFVKEVQLARQVTHANVCRVNEIFWHALEIDNQSVQLPLLTMELLPGETLAEQREAGRRFSESESKEIALAILAALEAAHGAGVVHGDLKPGNIMMVPERNHTTRVVITDFGLAGFAEDDERGMSATHSFAGGSPTYMAPEQLDGKPATRASDLYSFGLILYELLTGEYCFPPAFTFEEARSRVGVLPPGLRQHNPSIKAQSERVVLKCLHPEPKGRYRSAGEVKTALDAGGSMTRRSVLIAAGVLGVGVALQFGRDDSRGNDVANSTVAVLPFQNSAQDPAAAFFVDGLTAEIRRCMQRLPGLRVSGADSSASIGAANLSYAGAAQRLGAYRIISGSVRMDSERVRVSAMMTDAANGLPVMNRTFEAKGDQALSLQIELATAIAGSLNLTLTPAAMDNIQLGGARNNQSSQLYMRARMAAAARNNEGYESAIAMLTEALRIDSQFGLAWTAMGQAYSRLAGQSGYPVAETMSMAERTLLRALEVSIDLPEALLEKGLIDQRYHWKWYDAAATFRKAVQFNPNLVDGHRFLSGLSGNLGKSEESIREIQIARELDPLSVSVQNNFGAAFYRARIYRQAQTEFERVLQMDPSFTPVYPLLADTLGRLGDWPKAASLLLDVMRRSGDQPMLRYGYVNALAMSGRLDEARRGAEEMEKQWASGLFFPTFIVNAYCGINDEAKVFEWLDVAFRERDPGLVLLKIDPNYDAYRSHPRFKQLMAKVGLEVS